MFSQKIVSLLDNMNLVFWHKKKQTHKMFVALSTELGPGKTHKAHTIFTYYFT